MSGGAEDAAFGDDGGYPSFPDLKTQERGAGYFLFDLKVIKYGYFAAVLYISNGTVAKLSVSTFSPLL